MEDSRYVSYLPNAYEPHIRYVQSSTNKIFPTEYHSLLTTIVDLQRNYIERLSPEYQDECSNDNKHEFNNYNSPLDLSVKSSVDITPPQSPQSFSIKRHNLEIEERSTKRFKENHYDTPLDFTKIKHEHTSTEHTIKEHCLNISSNYNILEKTPTKSATAKVNTAASKKLNREHSRTAVTKKVVRKLQFDEETRSPVSGTIIRELGDDEHLVVRKGDIDPAFNVVEVTDEAKAELAKIDNVIGDYLCRLCKELYEDAFTLAQHRCSRIMLIEYRCPECEKVFNCPANLASHRRWHKPRDQHKAEHKLCEGQEKEEPFPCARCGKTFRKQAYLRKHLNSHHKENVPSKQEEDAAVILTSLKLSGNDFRNLAV